MIPNFKTYIKESTWGEMRKRSSGEVVRKEDDLNDLSFDDFYEYLQNTYKPINKDFHIFNSVRMHDVRYVYVMIPIEMVVTDNSSRSLCKVLKIEYFDSIDKFTSIYLAKSLFNKYPNLNTVLDDEYKIEEVNKTFTLKPKDGKITNNKIVKLIDKILDEVDEPLLKK